MYWNEEIYLENGTHDFKCVLNAGIKWWFNTVIGVLKAIS